MTAPHNYFRRRAVEMRTRVANYTVAAALHWPRLMLTDNTVIRHLDRELSQPS